MSQAEMIQRAEEERQAEEAMATEEIPGWEDYPFDPTEEANFHDFEPDYRRFADDEEYPF